MAEKKSVTKKAPAKIKTKRVVAAPVVEDREEKPFIAEQPVLKKQPKRQPLTDLDDDFEEPVPVSRQFAFAEIAETPHPLVPTVEAPVKKSRLTLWIWITVAFLITFASVLLIVGFSTPFEVTVTIGGAFQSANVTLANIPFNMFYLQQNRPLLEPSLPNMFPFLDLALAGFSLFIITIPVIFAGIFIRWRRSAMAVAARTAADESQNLPLPPE